MLRVARADRLRQLAPWPCAQLAPPDRKRRDGSTLLLPTLLQVEDPKKALLLYGGRTSQTVKDVLADFGKLKAVRSVLFARLVSYTCAKQSVPPANATCASLCSAHCCHNPALHLQGLAKDGVSRMESIEPANVCLYRGLYRKLSLHVLTNPRLVCAARNAYA